MHDDLDDDDDGSISSTENNEFITEYGLSSSGSIAAMIGDSDGRISPAEFLTTWKRSEVYRWSATDVIEWLKGDFSFFYCPLTKKVTKLKSTL